MQSESTKRGDAVAKFIQHACYKLPPSEQKLIFFLATLLKAGHDDAETYLVPTMALEHILKSGPAQNQSSFYQHLDELLDSITDKKITFPTDFTIEGIRQRGQINWLAGAVPKYNDDGVLCVEFCFSPQVKPFLLGLKEKFSRSEFMETAQMKSGFSIRIYQLCKSYYSENIQHGRNILTIGINELKHRLGISDKHPDFRNFRRKVLGVAREEINQKTSLSIEYDFIRKGRSISDIRIVINGKTNSYPELKKLPETSGRSKKPDQTPSLPDNLEKRLEKLTEAQRRAFHTLAEYGVSFDFALDEVLPIIKGSELDGYEDFFVSNMLAFFEKKTNVKNAKGKAKAFCGWVGNKRFEDPNLYAQLIEEVVGRKKKLKPAERANRERAKNITAAEFRKLLEDEKPGQPHKQPFSAQERTNPTSSHLARIAEPVALPSQPKQPKTAPKPKFDFELFKKESPDTYKQIRKERSTAFANLKSAANYKQMLENSIQAYCEQWYKKQ